jgi:cyclopropane fatty-acyl-phospholipid synthase-like methyltransferase
MVIDLNGIKNFWENRAKKDSSNSGVTNLEPDKEKRDLKIKLEEAKVFKYIDLSKDKSILDLGGGYGAWALKFAPNSKQVTVVEYCDILIKTGEDKKVANIDFILSAAQDFKSEKKFDTIFISGLFIYLNDNDVHTLLSHIKEYTKDDSIIILRDGTGIQGQYEINNRYSEALKANYSALYRTPEKYIELFKEYGFDIEKHEDVFDEGCELNKFPETRLRIYKFKKNGIQRNIQRH